MAMVISTSSSGTLVSVPTHIYEQNITGVFSSMFALKIKDTNILMIFGRLPLIINYVLHLKGF